MSFTFWLSFLKKVTLFHVGVQQMDFSAPGVFTSSASSCSSHHPLPSRSPLYCRQAITGMGNKRKSQELEEKGTEETDEERAQPQLDVGLSKPGVHLLSEAPGNTGKQQCGYRVVCVDTCLKGIKFFLVRKTPCKGISLCPFIVQEM